MADTKITALAAIATVDPAADVLPIVDISDTSMAASGTTKKVTSNQILGSGGTATLASATITGAATVGTTLGVTGVSTLASASITGAATVGSTLGVTGVSTFAAGTALLPALTTTGDVNTGIYYPAADTFAVTTGGTERYRVDSTGLCVGTTPSHAIQAYGTAPAIASGGTTTMSSAGQIGASFILRSESTSAWTGTREMVSFDSIGNGADHRFGTLSIKLKAGSADTTLTEYFQINPVYGYTLFPVGNLISTVPTTPPTLATNSQMVFNLTSNTNLRISVRGTDGTTRTANILLV